MWCRQRSLWDQEWNSIVFSDESRFCLGMHDGRARVRRRRSERRNPQFFVERHTKKGHIATIPLNEQRTVTADWYTTIWLPKNHPSSRQTSSHTAQTTRQYLTEENVELLDHPPYSPGLSPNDFFTFSKIENRLRGQTFQSPEEAVDAFKNAVFDLPANEWNTCFKNWFERMQMYINLRGEYFEKQ
ncbi:unnamed protein product [Acanthoscelides obtectus]|uniref:Transposase n=1 Tax=Acanthoscelides obtectus TaxID=200917 RepID=A0A9P0L3L4_ACAOB|nr:unnamed protein product [Acanthoscelides obtectus]CAK1629563.1 Histone-lysine N-methyltransferase SETMAR [Acanthoscelides obtectus]